MRIRSTDDGRWNEHRQALEEMLTVAQERGDAPMTAEILIELCRFSHWRRDFRAMERYADEAWQLTQRECLWNHAGRLSLWFGDVALDAQDYPRSYDHYANACAYTLLAGVDQLWRTVECIDDVLVELIAGERLLPALGLCELLIGYEEYLGLGEPVPAFVQHFARWRDRIEGIRLNARVGEVGARN